MEHWTRQVQSTSFVATRLLLSLAERRCTGISLRPRSFRPRTLVSFFTLGSLRPCTLVASYLSLGSLRARRLVAYFDFSQWSAVYTTSLTCSALGCALLSSALLSRVAQGLILDAAQGLLIH